MEDVFVPKRDRNAMLQRIHRDIDNRELLLKALETTKGGKTFEQLVHDTGLPYEVVEYTMNQMKNMKLVEHNGPSGFFRWTLRRKDVQRDLHLGGGDAARGLERAGCVREGPHGRDE